jgi:uncharacterized membrane protein
VGVKRHLSDSARANWSSTIAVAVVGLARSPRILEGLQGGLNREESLQLLVQMALFSWPLFVATYLIWTYVVYSKRAPEQHESEPKWWMRLVGATGTLDWPLSAAAIAVLLTILIAQNPEYRSDPLYLLLGILAVVCSWMLMITSFALNYYRLNADPEAQQRPAIVFAFEERATLSDYVTLAVLLSTMAAAVSARINSRVAWRLVRTNVLLAFTFNTVIVAMVVSLVFGGLTS